MQSIESKRNSDKNDTPDEAARGYKKGVNKV